MGDKTKIGWCEDTRNRWGGCTKVSDGCKGCYATVSTPIRTQGIEWGAGKPRKLFKGCPGDVAAAQNRAFSERHNEHGELRPDAPHRPRQFWMSLGDWLDDEVEIEWLADLLRIVACAPDLHHMMLTKRPENFAERFSQAIIWLEDYCEDPERDAVVDWLQGWQDGSDLPDNVTVMASMENHEMAMHRMPLLMAIPSASYAISAEPLLGSINWPAVFGTIDSEKLVRLDQVILGGESDPGIKGFEPRPCDLGWLDSSIAVLTDMGIPVYVKQFGALPVIRTQFRSTALMHWGEPVAWKTTGAKRFRAIAGTDYSVWPVKHKKGERPDEWPEAFRIQQTPGWRRQQRTVPVSIPPENGS